MFECLRAKGLCRVHVKAETIEQEAGRKRRAGEPAGDTSAARGAGTSRMDAAR